MNAIITPLSGGRLIPESAPLNHIFEEHLRIWVCPRDRALHRSCVFLLERELHEESAEQV